MTDQPRLTIGITLALLFAAVFVIDTFVADQALRSWIQREYPITSTLVIAAFSAQRSYVCFNDPSQTGMTKAIPYGFLFLGFTLVLLFMAYILYQTIE